MADKTVSFRPFPGQSFSIVGSEHDAGIGKRLAAMEASGPEATGAEANGPEASGGR